MHLSVLGNGDAVSVTSTINLRFGALYIGKTTGIIYNNDMDDFSTPNMVNAFGFVPSISNYIKPRKRPMSSMSPIIVLDQKNNVRLVLGASGGSRIISSVAQVAIKNLFIDSDIKKNIDDKRIHHQLYPENVRRLLSHKDQTRLTVEDAYKVYFTDHRMEMDKKSNTVNAVNEESDSAQNDQQDVAAFRTQQKSQNRISNY